MRPSPGFQGNIHDIAAAIRVCTGPCREDLVLLVGAGGLPCREDWRRTCVLKAPFDLHGLEEGTIGSSTLSIYDGLKLESACETIWSAVGAIMQSVVVGCKEIQSNKWQGTAALLLDNVQRNCRLRLEASTCKKLSFAYPRRLNDLGLVFKHPLSNYT